MWEEYEQVLKTLLHEFRHAMQHKSEVLHVEVNCTKIDGLRKMRENSRRGS